MISHVALKWPDPHVAFWVVLLVVSAAKANLLILKADLCISSCRQVNSPNMLTT